MLVMMPSQGRFANMVWSYHGIRIAYSYLNEAKTLDNPTELLEKAIIAFDSALQVTPTEYV